MYGEYLDSEMEAKCHDWQEEHEQALMELEAEHEREALEEIFEEMAQECRADDAQLAGYETDDMQMAEV